MYNLPELCAAQAALWSALAAALRAAGMRDVPDALDFDRRPVPDAIGPEILFTQTCGYPLQTRYAGSYQLLGVPSYDLPGCGDASHCAFVVVRAEDEASDLADLRGRVFALNSRDSNSGMNLPRLSFARLAGGRPFFRHVVETGGHPASMALVAAGGADAASIDCVTWGLLARHRPTATAGLRVLAETVPSPAIPFVTSVRTADEDRTLLIRALLALPPRVLAPLALREITPADPTSYGGLLAIEREAASRTYPELA